MAFALTAALSVQADDSNAGGTKVSGWTVRQLIEQLGADSYATRTRAMERLQRMGLEAFDELHLAQFHPDIEIEMAARYLVSSLLVSWSKETDPTEVREALYEYGAQNETDRNSRIELLAELSERRGLQALVRLTRFETSLRLSRTAALALMQQPMSDDEAIRRRNAQWIEEGLDDNDRQASQWLKTNAKDLSQGGYSADRWRELIAVQRNEIDASTSQAATRPSVLELVQVCATRAIESGNRNEALQLARSNIDLIDPTSRHLVDACSWAIDHQLHPFVLDMRSQFSPMFDQQPVLLYGAAEAEKVGGDDAKAEALADKALEIRPFPANEEERKKWSPREVEETAQSHFEIGASLEERGLFHWAEREFRKIIEHLEVDAAPSAVVRGRLARMLGELERHEAVVEVLEPLVQRVEKDDKMKQRLNLMFVQYNDFRAEMTYHSALAKIKKGKVDEGRDLLVLAFSLSESPVDILITMYRTDGDDGWKALVQSKLVAEVRKADAELQRAIVQSQGKSNDPIVANLMNQYAWLVSNTEGDYRKALDFSLRSLEMDADYAKYDTCARCYFAVKDYDNALLMQKRALKLMPHSPPLVRQLKQFEEARAKAENEMAKAIE
ncbi:tetratricopeptide repeat protein [Rubripirellula tenax]|nr:hypothetical protein [Rubripirellula tenax]